MLSFLANLTVWSGWLSVEQLIGLYLWFVAGVFLKAYDNQKIYLVWSKLTVAIVLHMKELGSLGLLEHLGGGGGGGRHHPTWVGHTHCVACQLYVPILFKSLITTPIIPIMFLSFRIMLKNNSILLYKFK